MSHRSSSPPGLLPIWLLLPDTLRWPPPQGPTVTFPVLSLFQPPRSVSLWLPVLLPADIFSFVGHMICHSSAVPSEPGSRHRRCVSKQVWPCADKTLLTKTGCGPASLPDAIHSMSRPLSDDPLVLLDRGCRLWLSCLFPVYLKWISD